MQASARQSTFIELWLILAAVLTGLGIIARSSFFLAGAALLIAVAGGAWLWSRNALRSIHYTRRFSETRVFPGEEVEVTLSVHSSARRRLPVQIDVVDAFPDGLPIDGRAMAANPASQLVDFRTHWAPGGHQRLSRSFRLACPQRGLYRFGPATMAGGDPFGLFERSERIEGVQRLVVYPTLFSVEELRLPARTLFGDRTSRLPLVEDPLRSAGVREWQEGDSLRRIHWSASLRTQSLQSRIYEPSEDLQVMMVLNVATLERHWQGVRTVLYERAISVAASLAAAASAERLPVGLLANCALPESDQEVRLLPGRSPYQLMHLLELLAGVSPFATAPIEEMVEREAPRLPRGATLVVVTAIAHEALLVALSDLAQAGRPVVLVTLADEPPRRLLPRVTIYHLPHLIDDVVHLVAPDPALIGAESDSPFEPGSGYAAEQQYEEPKPAREEPSPWARPLYAAVTVSADGDVRAGGAA